MIADQAWVLKPHGPVRAAVVYVHGWGDTSPAHHAWFDHLRARGVAVVFPRYQVDTSDPAPGTIGHLRNGLRHAFADPALRGKPVVAVGYSWGAKLVFDYGVNAKRWGVPAPRAIESIFPPSRTYGGPPHGRLPPAVRVLLFAGELDNVPDARAFWRWLRNVPQKTFRVIANATHDWGGREDAVGRRLFWAPLDGLVARYT